jgi:hypothetical protein
VQAETAAFIKELLRRLSEETEKSLAVLKGESVPPSTNGGAAASAPSTNRGGEGQATPATFSRDAKSSERSAKGGDG